MPTARPPTRRAVLLAALVLPLLPAAARAALPAPGAPTPGAPTPAALDSSPAAAPAPPPLSKLEQTLEVLRLQDALAREVPRRLLPSAAQDAATIALARAELSGANTAIDRPQLIVVVDRNPRAQLLSLVLAQPGPAQGDPAEPWRVLGAAKVSTGSTGRFDHYITPRGVFHVTPAILGFRAEGTENENGIRGLGAKGMRVWDFGWQVASKGWDAGPGKPDRTPIRLMMHATDPDKLEGRIGHPASQGCVRIPSAMNRFLDRHGVLDSEYERAAATDIRFRALLPPDRQPSSLAGNTLVVVDSADRSGVAVASRAQP